MTFGWNSNHEWCSLCNFLQYPVISSTSGPDIFLITCNTLSPCHSLWETFQMKLYVTVCITATINSPFPESILCTDFHTQPSLHWPGYRLHVPGIVVWFLAQQDMFVSMICRQTLGPTQPASQWALRLKQLGLEVRHNLVPKLRMSGATSPFPQYAFMACTGNVTISSSLK